MFSSAFDLLQVILGFSLIIVVHELGHFVAARWAGIRVLAFAVGFGPALFSFRKGLGVRSGSSEQEFRRLVKEGRTAEVGGPISATEYRLNVLPLGGYVKMLGQDDSDPSAVSSAPDSYQVAPPWKRMIVISAGVVMNLILAAALFCGVFLVGMQVEAARIGEIDPDGPAASAALISGPPGVEPRLQSTDRILSLDGKETAQFNDVALATAMARGGRELDMVVAREGALEPLTFRLTPRVSEETRMLELGIGMMASSTLASSSVQEENKQAAALLAKRGMAGLQPGMRLVEVEGKPAESVYDLFERSRRSDGRPVRATFEQVPAIDPVTSAQAPARVTVEVPSLMELSVSEVTGTTGTLGVPHVLGLAPLVKIESIDERFETAVASGFEPGDIISRIGSVAWPTPGAAMQTIRGHAGKTLSAEVLRESGTPGSGEWKRVELPKVGVTSKGQIGLGLSSALTVEGLGAIVGAWPEGSISKTSDPAPLRTRLMPGSRVVGVNGKAVGSYRALREELRRAARSENPAERRVELRVELPPTDAGGADRRVETVTWAISDQDAATLEKRLWVSGLTPMDFQPERVVLKEGDPLSAVARGVHETHVVMMTAYVSFARLVQGTVRVQHLKGPVGIADLGTQIAKRGPTWLVFFLAIISVNLAVVNFLPIPITDGGHFLFLVYEAISGKPPPIAVQNAAMLAGMVLLGAAFLFVFVNDIIQLAT